MKNIIATLQGKTKIKVETTTKCPPADEAEKSKRVPVSQQEELILEALSKHGDLTNAQLRNLLGLSRHAVARRLQALMDEGKVASVGLGAQVRYTVDEGGRGNGRWI